MMNKAYKDKLKIIGLMSGTSCDGLDIALIEINGSGIDTKFKFIAGKIVPYTVQQKNAIKRVISSKTISLKDLSQINFYLPQIWSDMIDSFLKENNLNSSQIDLIGSHGQTIWHQPHKETFAEKTISSTLQIGDPSVLAQLIGITTVGDFRVADIALGGQGAPLIPYFDWAFFRQFKMNILSVNIGGISNLTFIPKDGDINKVIAFDCGPGNMLIDGAIQQLFNNPFDKDGEIASEGGLSKKLFDFIITNDKFVELKVPKSTGREQYNESFLKNILKFSMDNQINKNDIINTLSKYTAYSIHQNYKLFVQPESRIDEIVVAGGGAHNKFIMRQLEKYFSSIIVIPISKYGIDIDLKEAIGFAILANETTKGNPSNIPQVTGARKPAILGKICMF